MLCKEGMPIVEARSALSIPQDTKYVALAKMKSNRRKIDKYCINYGMTNHNVDTCKNKTSSLLHSQNCSQWE